jgi:DNA polymerase-3 subunit gamma/tau
MSDQHEEPTAPMMSDQDSEVDAGPMMDFLAASDTENNVKSGSYQVLARKYRPQNFDDMIGQEAMVQTLRNAFESGRIAHAFMLTGVRGVGKTTTARILARALNYQTETINQPSTQLSDAGLHCTAIMEGRHVDVMEMDAASRTGINDIREIIEGVRYGPASARFKVYIIDEVHMLSTAAFNGLLKTLEEPPPHVKFIFATTEIRKVPVTVLSRCQRFDLRRLTTDDTVHLIDKVCAAESVSIGAEAKALIARAAEGSARDALSLLDRALAHAGENLSALDGDTMRGLLGLADSGRILDLLDMIMRGDVVAALNEFAAQYEMGADPAVIIADLADTTHWITRLKFIDDADADVTIAADQRRRGREMADKLSMRNLARSWQALGKGHQDVLSSHNPRTAAEMVIIRLTHMADLPTPDELVRAYQQAQPQSTTTTSAPAAPAAPAAQTAPPQARRQSGGAPVTVMQTETAYAPHVQDFASLLELVAEKREIGLKYALETDVHLISFVAPHGDQPGKIELRLANPASNVAQELTRKLRDWTHQKWLVSVAGSGGAQTIAARKEDIRRSREADAKSDPLIAAALKAFPDAEIISVTNYSSPPASFFDAEDAMTDGD